jgi:hypothetical protein
MPVDGIVVRCARAAPRLREISARFRDHAPSAAASHSRRQHGHVRERVQMISLMA